MDLIEIDLPGPLPEAFLALSAAAIPDNPADLVARSAPSHWWFASGGRARAWVVPGRGRIAAFDHPDARTDGRNVGFFGWWESTGDATADCHSAPALPAFLIRSAPCTRSGWCLASVIASGTPRKSGAWSMTMCRTWLSIHSPQYKRRRRSRSTPSTRTPSASSTAWHALIS